MRAILALGIVFLSEYALYHYSYSMGVNASVFVVLILPVLIGWFALSIYRHNKAAAFWMSWVIGGGIVWLRGIFLPNIMGQSPFDAAERYERTFSSHALDLLNFLSAYGGAVILAIFWALYFFALWDKKRNAVQSDD